MNLLELHEHQLRLESEATRWTVERYHRRTHNSKGQKRSEASTIPGNCLLRRVVPQLGELLRDKLQNPGKGGNQRQAREWLSQCGLDEDTIAYITLKVLLSNIGKNISATAHSGNIEKCLWTEIEVRKLQEQAPSYLWAIVENLKGGEQMHSGAIKQNIFLNAKRRIGITDSETPRYLKIRVGLFLLRLVDSLGIFELRTIKDQGNRKKKKSVVVPAEALIEYLQRGHDEAEVLAPIRLPMVLPPLAWTPETDGHDGGYLTVRSSLVHHVGPNAIYDPGPDGFPPELLEAVNRIQNQEWRINKGILLVLESLQKAQSGLGGLPELPELPEAEWATGTPEENRLAFRRMAEENPDALRDFKEKRRETHHVRLRESGKLIALRMQLKIARMYKDYKRVYFPHFLCSRGRVYPSVLFLNPQGDDRAKALLEFAEGKPLDSVEAVEWWMIHGANAYGYDKVSFGDRVKWVFDHHHEIMECAQNPLENKWWAESSSPFKFLAWCFEYLRRQKDPHGFLTHCPVAMDGTCSGLQHYSALLRDSKGAAAVNLLHSEKPKDIYQDVADIANRKLKELSESDAVIPATGRRPEAPVRRFARVWLGKITRDVAKPGTMTNPYGVTRRGMSEQLRELQEKGKLDIKTDDVWGANSFMADVLYDAVNEVVVSAEVGKEWLRKVGNIIAKEGKDVTWKTPLGFLVRQRYRKWRTKRIDTVFGSTRIQLTVATDETPKVDTHRATNGIAPNFIHSLDATHLVMTTCKLPKDLNLCVIHDSFATHATDIETLRGILKGTFVELYDGRNYLQELRDSLPELPEGHEGYPPVPALGDLDVREVLKSEYLFS